MIVFNLLTLVVISNITFATKIWSLEQRVPLKLCVLISQGVGVRLSRSHAKKALHSNVSIDVILLTEINIFIEKTIETPV